MLEALVFGRLAIEVDFSPWASMLGLMRLTLA